MTAIRLEHAKHLATALALRFARCRSGIAAVEFAFIVPIMLCLFIGVVELSQAITIDRRVSHVTSSTADLVARQRTIDNAALGTYMQIVDNLLSPYSATPMKLTIASIYNTTSTPAQPKVCWVYQHNGGANTGVTQGANYAGLPANLLDAAGGTSVVMVEASYLYVPVMFFSNSSIRVQGAQVSSFIGSAGITLSEKFYLKPRLSSSVAHVDVSGC